MRDPNLVVEGLHAGYGEKTVLRGIELQVPAGSAVALIGPNGSGKSTFLKALCQSCTIHSGSIRLGDQDLSTSHPSELARLVGYVPQYESVKFGFTSRQLVAMGRIAANVKLFETLEDERIVEASMEQADCIEFADRMVFELSGGEQQRVRIARALAQQPVLLLLDEPAAHLDVKHQAMLWDLLRRLASDGMTILAAVHDLNAAVQFAAATMLLHEGRAVSTGPTLEVLASEALGEVFETRFETWAGPRGESWIVPDLGSKSG